MEQYSLRPVRRFGGRYEGINQGDGGKVEQGMDPKMTQNE
jgi:hypothetical protein